MSRPADFCLAVDGRVLEDRYHGIGRVTESLLRKLAERAGVEVVVFLREGQTSRRFDLDELTTGLGHRRRIFDYAMTSPLQWVAWPKAIRAAKADAVLFPYNLGASLFGSTDRYTVVHDCIMEENGRFAPGRVAAHAYRLVTGLVVRRTRVLTPSHASAADLRRTYRIEVTEEQVIPWGVDRSFFAAVSPSAQLPHLPANYVLHVGVRRPHKNVSTLVRALTHLPEGHHLVLVGSVDTRFPDPVPQLASRLGVAHRIVHLPFVDEADLAAVYAGAQAFVYPSLAEGFGLPLLEAMAAGLPVIASDIPVFREVAGRAATLVPALDAAAWADAICRLENGQQRAAQIQAGRDRASSATWDKAVDALIALVHPRNGDGSAAHLSARERRAPLVTEMRR